MTIQIIIVISTLAAFTMLGFMLNASIKKHESRKVKGKKKGRSKYMPEVKKLGR